jgi:hypothetical protein
MTNNKEAIETIKKNYPSSNYTMLREALDHAIEVLKRFDGAVEVAWVAGNIMSDGGIKLKEKPFQFINTSNHKLYAIPKEKYCSCEFLMIMRDSDTDIPFCSECKKQVKEQNDE